MVLLLGPAGVCKGSQELGVGKGKAWGPDLVGNFLILTTQESGDQLWRAPEQRVGPWGYWNSVTQRPWPYTDEVIELVFLPLRQHRNH